MHIDRAGTCDAPVGSVVGRVAIGSAVGAIEASKIPTFADARVGRRDEGEEAHKRQQKTLVPQRRREATFGHPSGIPQATECEGRK